MEKRLVRSKKERMLLGVLGGIAEHLNVDPTLVRLIFVVLLVFNPVAMTLLYFLAAIIIPEEGEEEEKPLSERLNEVIDETGKRIDETFSKDEKGKTLALALLIIGLLLLATSLFPIFFPIPPFAIDFRTAVAVILLVVGIILLARGD